MTRVGKIVVTLTIAPELIAKLNLTAKLPRLWAVPDQ